MNKISGSTGLGVTAGVALIAIAGLTGIGLSQNKTETTTTKTTPSAVTTPKTPEKTKQECLIKGNINNKGEKIYHMPGQKYYDKTIIEPEKGERWFCTEQEATTDGWRKSKV